jgi:hypothetical protein
MGMSSVTVDQSTGRKSKGDDSFDIEGMVFPLLKLIVTTRPSSRTKILCSHKQEKDDLLQDIDEVTVQNELLAKGDRDGCETPKSEDIHEHRPEAKNSSEVRLQIYPCVFALVKSPGICSRCWMWLCLQLWRRCSMLSPR